VAQAEESVVNQLGVPNVKSFTSPASFSLAGLDIEARDVSGHSPGLTNFAIHGLDRPLSIVGDAIFAGSIGGVKADYPGTLDRIRRNILSDQLNTVLACGHGPLTTVGLELKNNPFFAKTPGV
jgi:glyoxylase-like metal-dependent hydrolase (beta-lactamase superfamily II)